MLRPGKLIIGALVASPKTNLGVMGHILEVLLCLWSTSRRRLRRFIYANAKELRNHRFVMGPTRMPI